MKISECCQSHEHEYFTGLCSQCKEHADFTEEDEEDVTPDYQQRRDEFVKQMETQTEEPEEG